MKNLIAGVFGVVVWAYLIGAFISAPIYNWQFANKHGFLSWLFLGEVSATLQSFTWPVDAYRMVAQKDPVAEAVKNAQEMPPMTKEETDAFNAAVNGSIDHSLSEGELQGLRGAFSSYTTRTGRYLTSLELTQTMTALTVSADYQHELSKSAVMSWDQKKKVTTAAFDTLFERMKAARNPEQIENDLLVLDAAARNDAVLADKSGARYEFGRALLVSRVARAETAMANNDRIKTVLAEFVK